MLTKAEKQKLKEIVKKVDEEYGFKYEIINNFLTTRCVEFLCIHGDGRACPCPGNESIVGNVKTHSIKELRKMIIDKFPCHDPRTFDGNCCYRERI